MKLCRHPSLYSALAVAVLTALPHGRADAGVVRLVFNNSSQSIGLNQSSGDLISYLNHPNDRYLRLHLSEPLLCGEFPGSASSNVRVRFIDANGDVIANNNSSGVANTFGSLTDVSGGSGGIRYLPIPGGENRLQLNTTTELNCVLFSTFVSTGTGLPGKAAGGYQLRVVGHTMKAAPEGADDVFHDGFEDNAPAGTDLVTTISAPSTVRAGQNYVYTITVRNNGSTALNNVQVRDFFYKRSAQPGGSNPVLESGNWTCASGGGGSCAATAGTGVIFASGVSLPSFNSQVSFTATRRVSDSPLPVQGSQFSVAAAAFISPSLGEVQTLNNAVVTNATIVITQPPQISGLPGTLSLNEDQSSSPIAFTLSDPDTDPNVVSVSAGSSNASVIAQAGLVLGGSGANRNLTISPVANQNGSATVTVTANDGGNTANASVVVTVNPVNDPPTFTWKDTCTVSNGGTWTPEIGLTPAQFTYPASSQNSQNCSNFLNVVMGPADESGQSLQSATITNISNQAMFAELPTLKSSGNSALLSFRPNGTSGTSNVSVQVTDNGGTANGGIAFSSVRTFRVKVDGAAPTITAISDQTINEDGTAGPVNFMVGDTDTPISSLTITRTSSNTTLVPLSNVVIGGAANDPNKTITVTPAPNEFGTSTITVTASDGDQQGQRTFLVTVNPINDPPSFVASDVSYNSGQSATPQQIDNWASAISVGPPNEVTAGQVPQQFFIERLDNNTPNIIGTTEPSVPIPASGRLTFSLRNNGGGITADGFACYRAFLADSGSSSPAPNNNLSAEFVFKIQVGPGTNSCAGLKPAATSKSER